MVEFLKSIFSPNDFMPQGHGYLWTPKLVWLHVISDTLIGLAYLSIPVTLVYFIRKRRDVPFNWMFFAFSVSILACGATHFIEVWSVWHATYWLAGAMKALTAAASILTAILLVKVIPQALTLPSPDALRKARDELALQVQKRTADLLQTTRNLEAEITERKRAGEQLKAAFKELGDLKAALDEYAIVATTDAQGKITYVNDNFCTISKYSREELLGQDHRIINSGHHPKEFMRNLWTTITHGRVWHGEFKNKAKDGSFYWVDATIVPFLNEQGKPRQYVAIRTDITARKHAEEEVRKLNTKLEERVAARTAELAAANKELEAFCYSVSHDLRAPLRGLDGFSQALLEDYGDKLGSEGQKLLQRIRAGSQRMGQLIDDLLNLSRVSRSELRREPVNLSGLAGDVAEELHERDPQRQVALRIAEDLQADGDPQLLRVVLENLLGNAWKYTAKRPQATIEFGLSRDNGHSWFYVRDDGVGFDMQYVDKLFAPFQRLHGMNEFPGTGVGLATVQRIIHRHGGRVWAEAEVNKGATFHFTLS